MRLYVPTNGDQLLLTADWAFTLYAEDYGNRNKTLFERLKIKKINVGRSKWDERWVYPKKVPASLPAGSVLQVDRVYIRKFNKTAANVDDDFDSITFQLIKHPVWSEPKKKVLARFWVKLKDANTIEFEHAAPPRWSEENEDGDQVQ